jgi:STAS-like domain of unknown function (DUF4325)
MLDEWGPDVTGRTLGEQIRENLPVSVAEIIFDCSGVDTLSPSFADELFGKLAAAPSRPHIRVVNATSDVLATIRFAVAERTEADPPSRPRGDDRRYPVGDPRRWGRAAD